MSLNLNRLRGVGPSRSPGKSEAPASKKSGGGGGGGGKASGPKAKGGGGGGGSKFKAVTAAGSNYDHSRRGSGNWRRSDGQDKGKAAGGEVPKPAPLPFGRAATGPSLPARPVAANHIVRVRADAVGRGKGTGKGTIHADADGSNKGSGGHAEAREDPMRALEAAFAGEGDAGSFARLPEHVSREEFAEIKRLCRTVNPEAWDKLVVAFFENLLQTIDAREAKWSAFERELSGDWHGAPWYFADPHRAFAQEGASTATFADVEQNLDYVRELGFENIGLLPHQENDGLGTPSSITSFSPAALLGGTPGFESLLERARHLGMRMVTTATLQHTSIHHRWFERAMDGDPICLGFYVQCDPNKVPHKRLLSASIGEREVWFHHTRLPFQADLDLRNPVLLRLILAELGNEAALGSLGRIVDSVDAWFPTPGEGGEEGAQEADEHTQHALLGLLKLYLRLLGPRQILIPDVASERATDYLGRLATIAGTPTTSEGDVHLWLDATRGLRESLRQRDRGAVELALAGRPTLPESVVPVIPIEHPALGERNANVHGGDPLRIALSLFGLYMFPGTPLILAGSELGVQDDAAYAERVKSRQEQYLADLLRGEDEAELTSDADRDPSVRHGHLIEASAFLRRASEHYLPVEVLRVLNRIRRERRALGSAQVIPMAHAHRSVLAWVRGRDTDAPLLLLANLGDQTARLSLQVPEVRAAMGLSEGRNLTFIDLLAAGLGRMARPVSSRLEHGKVLITIPASGFAVLEVKRGAPGAKGIG